MAELKTTPEQKTAVEKPRPTRKLSPPVDIFENSDGFLIVADLPGVEPEGLKVEYNPPELLVRGERTDSGETVTYERRFELGSGIDPSSISAELKAGALRIDLKKAGAHRPRRIDVRAA